MSLKALDNVAAPPSTSPDWGGQRLSIQFEDIDQQNESYVVGMWTFLVTEIMFFGALFLAYSVYRVLYFSAYIDAHKFLSIGLGTTNTFVLLTSSFTMVLAVYNAQRGNRRPMMWLLAATCACSFAFLGIKYIEYTSKINEGLFPGSGWDYAKANHIFAEEHGGAAKGEPEAAGQVGGEFRNPETATFDTKPPEGFNAMSAAVTNTTGLPSETRSEEQDSVQAKRARLFFSIYFTMTGLHGVHVLLGIVMMVTIIILAYLKHPAVRDYMPTEMVGLYWHFVDIVWIFLFPLMYLIS